MIRIHPTRSEEALRMYEVRPDIGSIFSKVRVRRYRPLELVPDPQIFGGGGGGCCPCAYLVCIFQLRRKRMPFSSLPVTEHKLNPGVPVVDGVNCGPRIHPVTCTRG